LPMQVRIITRNTKILLLFFFVGSHICCVHFSAENTELPNLSFDLVTIMYGFHEVPMVGRVKILNEARRLLRRGGHLAIVDICPTYTPAAAMLAGEPFVLEYQQNIESQLANLKGFRLSKRKSVVPGHVFLWLLTAA
jgi:ubiquinone/menaquinone biosynthesis C-methylase UbiE